MAATFLINALERRQAADDPNRYRKGALIVVRPSAWDWGAKEWLPDFVRVTVTGVTYKQAAAHLQGWNRQTEWVVVSQDAVTDTFSLKLSNSAIAADGRGGFVAGEVDALLLPWGAEDLSVVSGEALFTLNIFKALTSNGFWDQDVSAVTFAEDAYDVITGQHIITATIPASVPLNSAINAILNRGGDVIASDLTARTIKYQMDRTDLSAVLKQFIQRKTLKAVARTRFFISEANVDTIIAGGGETTVTRTQFLNALQDSMTD